jgi:hypothetical protein
MTKIHQLL